MRILQEHVDFIEYEPMSKEISQAEEVKEKKKFRIDELVVLFVSVEQGDDEEVAKKAVEGTVDFLKKLNVRKVLIYPYAHLSQDLAKPGPALQVLKGMQERAKEMGLEVYRAPFGWNKAFQIKVKGHPLAEQSRKYSPGAETQVPTLKKKEREVQERPIVREQRLTEAEMLARVKKSDFTGLPETDHRIIGERLDLFSFQEPSPGMVYWHDKGLKLKEVLVAFLRAELAKRGYVEISTPALANTTLWGVSGHSEHYKDNMFLTHLGDEELGLKPMNCPSTFLIYKSRRWSFRELPVRYAIFDALYRNELSGVASGLFRLKTFSQDDAHIIAVEDQAEKELTDMLDLMKKVYGVFKLEYKVKISTRPDESMGSDEEWERATRTLMRVVETMGMQYEIKEKEGNFYAPKIDVDIKDSLGREWQCATFQLDLQMPKRFRLSYAGSDGKEHTPVVLHRTILGSLERFIGIITEHYQGKFPLWLSPVQVTVLPITDENVPYAQEVSDFLVQNSIRVQRDFESGTVGSKIRNAQLQKIPYMLVIGQKEQDGKTVAVRTRDGNIQYGVKVEDLLKDLTGKVESFAE